MNQRLLRTFFQCVGILSPNDKRKLLLITGFQSFLGILDLIGVALLGAIGALSIRGVQSQNPGDRVAWVINHLGLGNLGLQGQVVILTSIAVTVLVAKTFLSIILSRKVLFFLARRSAQLSSDLVSKTLNGELEEISSKNTLQLQYAVGPGVNFVGLGILGLGSTVVSDFSLLLILGLGLLVIDGFTFATVTLLFTFIGVALYKLLHSRARRVGSEMARFNIESNKMLNESLMAFREIFVRNRQAYYAESISNLKLGFANASAEQTFLPNVSKYIIEISVTLGAVVVAAIQFSTQDAPRAVASLALFIAAGSRIAPALLRIQQSLIQMQTNIGGSIPTLELIKEFRGSRSIPRNNGPVVERDEFCARVEFSDVSFKYKNSTHEVISKISLKIEPGEFIAIAGSSGSGKSTIVDLLLGLLQPSSGSISISGENPRDAISRWPSAISYVPQSVSIFEDSVLKNIGLGFQDESISTSRVQEVLKLAQLENVVDGFPKGINEVLGERGNNLSGGQIQRVGIARALYNNPSLLVLDEATSALDNRTEAEITDMILELKGQLTLVVIAHRLSTIKNADRVILLKDGMIQASGTFNEVSSSVPDFDTESKTQ